MFTITLSIIVLTCLVSVTAFNNSKIIDDLIFWPPAISMRHQYYRFLTCGFIHADIIHLAFNMITLFFFGKYLEAHLPGELGEKQYHFAILYLGAIIVANIPTYFKRMDDYNYRSLGASGGVCAVLFAFVLFRPWEWIRVVFIPIPAIVYAPLFLIYSAYMSKKGGDNVNHDAHFWGALFGVVYIIVLHPSIISSFLNELMQPRFNF